MQRFVRWAPIARAPAFGDRGVDALFASRVFCGERALVALEPAGTASSGPTTALAVVATALAEVADAGGAVAVVPTSAASAGEA